jgi:hypothetical protein
VKLISCILIAAKPCIDITARTKKTMNLRRAIVKPL